MSGLDLLRDEDLRTEREEVKEPAKRWRNRYRALVDYYDSGTRQHRRPGDEWWGFRLWPSREVAEQAAADHIKRHQPRSDVWLDEWIDAFPEGERPE